MATVVATGTLQLSSMGRMSGLQSLQHVFNMIKSLRESTLPASVGEILLVFLEIYKTAGGNYIIAGMLVFRRIKLMKVKVEKDERCKIFWQYSSAIVKV